MAACVCVARLSREPDKPLVVELLPVVPGSSGTTGPEKVVLSPRLDRKQVGVIEPTRLVDQNDWERIGLHRGQRIPVRRAGHRDEWLFPAEVATRLGRSAGEVLRKRWRRRVPAFPTGPENGGRAWTEEELARLGSADDGRIAARLKQTPRGVAHKRRELPYPDSLLAPHAARRWAKNIRANLHHFAPSGDPDRAWVQDLDQYLEQKDSIHAGRNPREVPAGGAEWGGRCDPARSTTNMRTRTPGSTVTLRTRTSWSPSPSRRRW
ncbi:MAG TPA: hypothetical protein VKE74_07105 [Gemmataceae bacterium]|nr:hypothetical protein [Gemmataceae bacterium]